MYGQIFSASVALAWCVASVHASAQTEPTPAEVPTQATPVCADCIAIPALTPVRVEVLATIGSKTNKSGEFFPIRLAQPIVIDGREIVAAGATGVGEIVHAKKSGLAGAAGELVVAARYIDVGGQRLRLRSMRLSPAGRSSIDTINAIGVASAASGVPVAMIAFFVSGGQAVIPEGTLADAKTAEALTLTPSAITTSQPPAPESTPQKEGNTNDAP